MRILSVDDNTENLYLIEALGRAHGHEVISAHNGVEALEQLDNKKVDLIISDILMPEMDGFQLCRIVKLDDRWKRIPFIFYTATYTSKEDEALAFSLGASRFIVKPVEPEEFVGVIEEVMREGEGEQRSMPSAKTDNKVILSLYNQALVRKLERKIDQLESARAALATLVGEKEREADARRVAQDALRQSERNFLKAFMSNPAAIAINDLAEHRYVEINETFQQITGYSRADVIGKRWGDIKLWVDVSERDEAFRILLEQGSIRNRKFKFYKKNGNTGTALLSAELIEFDGRPCAITAKMDITDRLRLEEQLQHAQKLESIGRLAGGVAHEFNNLLTVISGYNAMLLNGLEPRSPLRVYAAEVGSAAERAASLTMQLLAFSRKQMNSVKPVNMNTVVIDAERMLQHTIGEDIRVVTKLDAELGQVMTDADQMHQVIMNLAVNARDAMSQGGTLIIKTANVDVEGRKVFENPEPISGRHVLITVTDTGMGMSEELQQHIFEPFFTTKERGKGTGLGLSTVYGIVRQSNGWIEVSSKEGQGTSFHIFLPRMEGCVHDEAVRSRVTPVLSQGSGTILLVEDEDTVRRLTETMLREAGYKVISAGSGTDAVEVADGCPDEIDLLLTDVIMPGINAKELLERLRNTRPKLKVLFTSGYTDDVIASHGVLDPSVAYIAKPFSQDVLVAKVREVLGEVGESK
jgi:PAS domain S-box-containing protein